MNRPVAALDALAESVELAQRIGDRRGETTADGTMADAYRLLGNDNKDLELRLHATAQFRDMGLRGYLCRSLNKLAGLYSALGMPQQALDAYEEANALATALGLPQEGQQR